MREIAVADGTLAWDVVDLTPPWLATPSTVILPHGLGTNADMWSGWLPRLAAHHRVVRFDMRGCGRSGALNRAEPLSLEPFREDVLAVADAAGAERFHLMANRSVAPSRCSPGRRAGSGLVSVTTISSPPSRRPDAHPGRLAGVGRRSGKHARVVGADDGLPLLRRRGAARSARLVSGPAR